MKAHCRNRIPKDRNPRATALALLLATLALAGVLAALAHFFPSSK